MYIIPCHECFLSGEAIEMDQLETLPFDVGAAHATASAMKECVY